MAKTEQRGGKQSMCRQRINVDDRVYEWRYVRCGREKCWCGGKMDTGKPGHGPYWYLCGSQNGRWRKIYLGAELDTSRWKTPTGEIDWAAYDEYVERKGERQGIADDRAVPQVESLAQLEGHGLSAQTMVDKRMQANRKESLSG